MKWNKVVEYRTLIEINDEEYFIIARKEGSDEEFAIMVNNDYVADCEELPTLEFLEQIIAEEASIADSIGKGSFRLA